MAAELFRAVPGGVENHLDVGWRGLVDTCVQLTLGLVEPLGVPVSPDRPQDWAVPTDPAVARLLPTAYDDDDAATEFRHLTEADLREGKRRDAQRVRDTVAADVLPAEDAEAWLRALNDARLILASRLGLRTDGDADALMAGRGRRGRRAHADGLDALDVYLGLGLLQELLIEALDGPAG